jgi:hypothetical protein
MQELVQHHNLQQIQAPFTKEDIDNVVKKLHSDKALGPDGFNGLFLKKPGTLSKMTSINYVLISSVEQWIFKLLIAPSSLLSQR